jgi:cysteinyl-tRNA synthetase
MDDDLDTSGALAGIFDLVRGANAMADGGDAEGARRLAFTAAFLCGALGLPLRSGSGIEIDAATADLVRRRDQARADREWSLADSLRDELESSGWVVEDGPEGTRVRPR